MIISISLALAPNETKCNPFCPSAVHDRIQQAGARSPAANSYGAGNTAVDADILAGDIARTLGGKKGNSLCYLIGLAVAA